MEYDNYEQSNPAVDIKCVHSFKKLDDIKRDYHPIFCQYVIEHGRGGLLIEGFSGKYNICMDMICKWLSSPTEYADFNSAVKISISASIHYWNEELQHSISNGNWEGVRAIKAILADIMRSTPRQLREGLFNNLVVQNADDIAKQKEIESDDYLFKLTTGNNS